MMKVIQPNCRAQFTASDLDFIINVFASRGSSETLTKLLSDPDSLNSILDDEILYRSVLESNSCLKVSSYFYFYIIVRHVLRATGIEDRNVADYVAEMLAEFSSSTRARDPLGKDRPMDYLFDMLAALNTVDENSRFMIRAHVGNHSLFLSGVFPSRVHYRAQFRGAPEMEYYENLGSTNFRIASDHRLAQKYDLTSIYGALSEQFRAIRLALNDISERVMSIGDPYDPLEGLVIPNKE